MFLFANQRIYDIIMFPSKWQMARILNKNLMTSPPCMCFVHPFTRTQSQSFFEKPAQSPIIMTPFDVSWCVYSHIFRLFNGHWSQTELFMNRKYLMLPNPFGTERKKCSCKWGKISLLSWYLSYWNSNLFLPHNIKC